MHIGEGHGDGAPAELPAASGSASSSPVATAVPLTFTNDPPDPTPLRQAEQYEYTFRFEHSAVELLGVRPVRYPHPIVTARRVGRFAVELWIGHELVERVRFDFPLLGADDTKPGPRPIAEAPSMERGSFTATVLVPAAPRARSARLVDRERRTQAELPWPPAPGGLGPMLPMSAPSAAAPRVESSEPAKSGDASAGESPSNEAAPAPAGSGSVTAPSSAAPPAASPARAHPR
jgi:hypothetical protein